MPPGAGAGLVTLLEQLHGLVAQVGADLPKGNAALADLGQFLGAKEDLLPDLEIVDEELAQADRESVEYLLQQADCRIESPRQARAIADRPQAPADVLVHARCLPMCL